MSCSIPLLGIVSRILQRLLNTLPYLPCLWDCALLLLALNFCLPSALTLWICHQKPGGVGIGLSVAQVTTWWVLHRQAAFLCKYTRAVCCTTNNKKQEQTLHFNHVSGSRAANSVALEGGRVGDSWRVDLSLKYSPALLNLRAPLDICNYNLGKQLTIKNVSIFQTYVNTLAKGLYQYILVVAFERYVFGLEIGFVF